MFKLPKTIAIAAAVLALTSEQQLALDNALDSEFRKELDLKRKQRLAFDAEGGEAALPEWRNKDLKNAIDLLTVHHKRSMDAAEGNAEAPITVDADKFDIAHRVVDGIARDARRARDARKAKDDAGGKTVPTVGGFHGNKDSGNANHAENARGTGNDSRLRVEQPKDSRYAGPTSVWSGCGDAYSPGRVALAKDGSVLRIDSIFGGAQSAVSDVSVDDIFGKQPPTLANG